MNQSSRLGRAMRGVLLTTAAMNAFGALIFWPPLPFFRQMFELPQPASDFYLWIVSAWIFIFGVAYGWLALVDRPERLFIAVAGCGKLSFVLLCAAFWLSGQIPLRTAALSLSDLGFAVFFFGWLYQTRGTGRFAPLSSAKDT